MRGLAHVCPDVRLYRERLGVGGIDKSARGTVLGLSGELSRQPGRRRNEKEDEPPRISICSGLRRCCSSSVGVAGGGGFRCPQSADAAYPPPASATW